ncbi:hypothetical protein HC766_02865 [Candidatus Gracilibacteria bacterium]|nr:hypothetical protein [Candidatus Gracilibacteria bacterium]
MPTKNLLAKLIAILNIPLIGFFTALIVFSFFFYSPNVQVRGDIRGVNEPDYNSTQTIRLRFFEDSYEGEPLGFADYNDVNIQNGKFEFQIPLDSIPENSYMEACVIINEIQDDSNCSEQNLINPTSCQREYVGDLNILDYFQNIDLSNFDLSCASAISPTNHIPGNWFDDSKLATNEDYANLLAAIQAGSVPQQIINQITNSQNNNTPNLIFEDGFLSIEGGNSVNLNGLSPTTNITNQTFVDQSTNEEGPTNISLDGNVLVIDEGDDIDLSNLFLSVGTDNITNNSILSEDLADGVITPQKIADCTADGNILKFYQIVPRWSRASHCWMELGYRCHRFELRSRWNYR